MTLTADKLKKGVPAVVVSIKACGALKKRMGSLGLVPGAPIMFIRSAPFGDPLEFSVRDTRIAVRRSEAETLTVEYDKRNWTKRLFI